MFSLEPYIVVLYIIHTTISLILAIILSIYVSKRFVRNSEEKQQVDARRLEEIANRSKIFKLLFKVSLHKNNRKTNIIFMFLFNLSMPLVGYAFSIWVTWYLKNVSYEKKVVHTNILNLDEFGISFLKVERIFGEGSMSDLMTSEYAPKSKKLKALSALAHSASPANLKIIRQTLFSRDDEIRMFGYAIINKAEKSLNGKINNYLDIFNKENNNQNNLDREKIAEVAKELAPLYWEMIYTELSHESLKENFLKEVVKYIKIARNFYVPEIKNISNKIEEYELEIKYFTHQEMHDENLPFEKRKEYFEKNLAIYKEEQIRNNAICTKLYILMGRVYMNKKEYDNANTEFTIAQELHTVESSFILPYLAEIQFLTGNYRVVSSIMDKAKGLELNSTLFPIVEQWKAA